MIQTHPIVFISANDIIISTNSSNHAVRVTHKPTGIVAEYNRYNSSHKNKIEAITLFKRNAL